MSNDFDRDSNGDGRDSGRKENDGDRPRFGGGDRDRGGDRPRFGGGDRSSGGDRPRFGGGDRSSGGDRPRFGGGDRDRSSGGDRPRFGGGDRDRSSGGDRPRFGGGDRDRNSGGDRPRFGGGDRDRNGGGDRPRFGGGDRPRFGGGDRDRSSGGDRPRFGGGDRDRSSGGDRPRFGGGDRPFNREERPRFDRPQFDKPENLENPITEVQGTTEVQSAHEGHARPSTERFERNDRPRFERNDGGDRPRSGGGDRPRFGGGDRDRGDRPRFGGGDRDRGGDRNDRGGRFERAGKFTYSDRGPGGFNERSDLQEVMDLDKGIIKLIAKRARFLEKLITGKKLDSATEKNIRIEWEANAAKFCRNPKVSRELFVLVQSVEAISENDADQPFFNLSPAPKPVQVELPAPASSRIARYYLTLAGASGLVTSMKQIPITDTIVDGIKSLNYMGGNLRYENDGTVTSLEGRGLESGGDKVVHVGKDALNLWLTLALSIGLPYHLKITGENDLLSIDFTPISHFLPSLGARLVQVIPSQDGLPIRIESSGVLPEEIMIPADLPRDFVFALLLAAPFWESNIRFNMQDYFAMLEENPLLQREWDIFFEEVDDVLKACSMSVRLEDKVFICEKSKPTLEEEILVPSDAEICASFFLLPAFTSGYVQLTGVWQDRGQQRMLKEIMSFTGLEWTVIENSARSTGISDAPINLPENGEIPHCPVAMSTVLYALASQKGTELNISEYAEFEAQKDIITGFLSHIGFDENVQKIDAETSAWLAPSAAWAVAFSLGAYIRPRIKLVNPNILNDYYPFYWRMYNTLPNPELRKPERKHEQNTRRRVIAQGVYADVADIPKPSNGNEDI